MGVSRVLRYIFCPLAPCPHARPSRLSPADSPPLLRFGFGVWGRESGLLGSAVVCSVSVCVERSITMLDWGDLYRNGGLSVIRGKDT
jgi:hypothetical protein